MPDNYHLQGHDGADHKCHCVASAAAEFWIFLDSFSTAVTTATTATETATTERHTDGQEDPNGDAYGESHPLLHQLQRCKIM